MDAVSNNNAENSEGQQVAAAAQTSQLQEEEATTKKRRGRPKTLTEEQKIRNRMLILTRERKLAQLAKENEALKLRLQQVKDELKARISFDKSEAARVAEGACYRVAEFVEFSSPNRTYTKTAAKVNFFMNDAELEKLPHLTEYSMRRGRPGFVYLEKELIAAAEKKYGKQVFHEKRLRHSLKWNERRQEKEKQTGVTKYEVKEIKEQLEASLNAGLVEGKAGRTKFNQVDCSFLGATVDYYLAKVDEFLKEKNFSDAKTIVEALTNFTYERCRRIIKNDEAGIFQGKIPYIAVAWQHLATVPEMQSTDRIKIAKRLGRWGKRFNSLKDWSTSVFLDAMAEVMQQLRTIGPEFQPPT